MFISSAFFFQKYERFVDKSAKVLMAETVAPTLDRMFVEIRYKSFYMETSKSTNHFPTDLAFYFSGNIYLQAEKNKILTWYGHPKDTFFANRPLTGVTITFIWCFYRVTGVSFGQGGTFRKRNPEHFRCIKGTSNMHLSRYMYVHF